MCFFRHGSPICYRGRSIPITTDSLILSDRVTPLPSWRLWKLHFFPWAFFFWNIHMLNYKWSVFCEGSHIAKITVGIWLIDLDLIKLVWFYCMSLEVVLILEDVLLILKTWWSFTENTLIWFGEFKSVIIKPSASERICFNVILSYIVYELVVGFIFVSFHILFLFFTLF